MLHTGLYINIFLTCPIGQLTKTSCKSKSFSLVLYSAIKKTSGRRWRWLMAQLLGHFICLFTLIINIYDLGEGISTIKKITPGRGWGMTPGAWAIRHLICLITLIINIYGLRVETSTIKKFTSGGGGVGPQGLSYNAFNLPSHPDHKYIWFRVGISVTFVYTDSC